MGPSVARAQSTSLVVGCASRFFIAAKTKSVRNMSTGISRSHLFWSASTLVILSCCADPICFGDQPRTWSDVSGKFNVEGTFVDLEHGTVALRKTSGHTIFLPLDQLSRDDRRFVALAFRRLHNAKRPQAATPVVLRNTGLDRTKTDPGKLIAERPSRLFSRFIPQPQAAASAVEPQRLLQGRSEAELTFQLASLTPLLDIYGTNDDARILIDSVQAAIDQDRRGSKPSQLASKWIANRSELEGLPMLAGSACRISRDAAKSLDEVSSGFGRTRAQLDDTIRRTSEQASGSVTVNGSTADWHRISRSNGHRDRKLISHLGRKPLLHPKYVAALEQMLQAETPALRRHLIRMLDAIDGPKASTALAKRAVFDLSSENRMAATAALSKRDPAQYRAVLLRGLRYPWPAAASHAAEALVKLDDRLAAKDLVAQLDAPNPYQPWRRSDGTFAVRELVRVNHMRNCLLCHEPSTSESDLVRGRIPYPDRRLPREYYHSQAGTFVRADITRLKQDFSVTQPAKDNGRWPKMQRFDYLVRERALAPIEVVARTEKLVSFGDPNREAVLFALRKLTGKDAGKSMEAWRKLVIK